MVGTAGHIDHGKTALVKLLTGCDTDRLPEEKARGMTIDLGFAACTLPNDRRVGIVDVPGHERFIHNMVAGVTGIDFVLLVVAADDGVMPQTVEHFHIVRLLGVRQGMVAVTKIDLVPPERVAEVREQVALLVAGSFLEGRPVVPISAKTAEGFEAFYDTFARLVDQTAEREESGPFRLHVERAFVLQGHGVIISGIPRSGCVRAGETLQLLPGESLKRVRGLQVYGMDMPAARAGECVALKMADLALGEVRRGCVLATPGYFGPARFLDARFQLLREHGAALPPRTAIRLHVGTAEVPGHLVLPSLEPLKPGAEAYVQIQLKEPVVAAPGDPFVLRALSPVRTLGGGHVVGLDERRVRRSKRGWTEARAEQDRAFRDPVSALAYALKQAGLQTLRLRDLARLALIQEAEALKLVASMVREGRALELGGGHYLHPAALQTARERVLQVLHRFHDEQPMSAGFAPKDIVQALGIERAVGEAAIRSLRDAGALSVEHDWLFVPGRAPKLSREQAEIAEAVLSLYESSAFASPRPDELPDKLNRAADRIEPVFQLLLQSGRLVRLSDKVVLSATNLEISRRKLLECLAARGETDAATFKDALGATRKYAIPILEYWDKQGLTRRVGDVRRPGKSLEKPGPN
jgi:selenocysteine-specific elongation factor